ncbi:MAG TPA: hypothetical protein VFG72_11530 [Marmoricola sp.]|nr:hypothetical protein [Marmoricola sp.]
MVELAVWLVVVGVCDLVRAARDVTSTRRRVAIVGLGTALLVLAGVALDPTAGGLVLLLGGWLTTFLLWLLGSAAALSRHTVAARAVAFAGLGGGLVFGLLADGVAGPLTRQLPGALSDLDPETFFLVTGVGLAQLATANVAVRMVLDAVGVPASTNEKTLKGGRMLGPMERLLIVALALAGEVTAAAVVGGAKGLLRFPELHRGTRAGPSDLTEYFLIGTLASWLFALAGAGLVAWGSALL